MYSQIHKVDKERVYDEDHGVWRSIISVNPLESMTRFYVCKLIEPLARSHVTIRLALTFVEWEYVSTHRLDANVIVLQRNIINLHFDWFTAALTNQRTRFVIAALYQPIRTKCSVLCTRAVSYTS